MNPPLRSIVYVSTATALMSEDALEALLLDARQLNLETHVTGVLLYGGGTFMQCFEGDEAAMVVTYDRIKASRQHGGIIELANDAVAARTFGNWVMGYKPARQSKLLALSSAQWQRRSDGERPGDDESAGLLLLRNFWSGARSTR